MCVLYSPKHSSNMIITVCLHAQVYHITLVKVNLTFQELDSPLVTYNTNKHFIKICICTTLQ